MEHTPNTTRNIKHGPTPSDLTISYTGYSDSVGEFFYTLGEMITGDRSDFEHMKRLCRHKASDKALNALYSTCSDRPHEYPSAFRDTMHTAYSLDLFLD